MAGHWGLRAALTVVASLGLAASGQGTSVATTAGIASNQDGTPRVVVAAFDDQSRARIDNLGAGLADKLAARLAVGGVHIVGRSQIESLMQAEALDPTSPEGLACAARDLGADLLVSGVLESVIVDSATLDLGLVQLGSAEAHVAATVELIDAVTGGVVTAAAAEGTAKTSFSLSFDLGNFFAASASCDVCGGGLQSAETAYSHGALVSFGYSNGSLAGWFGLEVYASDGTFLRWLGWRFVPHGGCETWTWNQRDALGSPVPAGIYTARLRDGDVLTAAASFQIRPSLTLVLPSLDQVTTGTSAFDNNVVGKAVDDVVEHLAKSLLASILALRTAEAARASTSASLSGATQLLGQIASVLPDGRVTINLGASSGVSLGDRFEVLSVDNLVFDRDTQSVASYDIVAERGIIEVVDVRERASTGTRLGDFDVLVGDLVRFAP